MEKLLRVSPSPHVYSKYTVQGLMKDVIIALLPAFAFSVYLFGWSAIIVTLTAVVSCVVFEFLIQKYLLKIQPTIRDGSAIVTGMLLAYNVPANLPVWIIVLGSLVAIGIAKMSFGGLGNNPFNPALVGRVFLLSSFPVQMTSWPVPNGFETSYTDAVTGATPLGIIKEGVGNGKAVGSLMEEIPSYLDLFMGNMKGSLGEMAAIALLIGFVYLLWRRVITWHIPFSVLGTMVVFTGILWLIDPSQHADPLFHLLTGGALLGAIYMATDYSSSPMTVKGMLIYGFGIGLLTAIIRISGAYPEGMSFAIIIMNAFVPIINRYIPPKRFGEEVKK